MEFFFSEVCAGTFVKFLGRDVFLIKDLTPGLVFLHVTVHPTVIPQQNKTNEKKNGDQISFLFLDKVINLIQFVQMGPVVEMSHLSEETALYLHKNTSQGEEEW